MDIQVISLDATNCEPFLPMIPPEMQEDGYYYIGALVDNAPCALAVTYWSGNDLDLDLYIEYLFVPPSARNQGIGRRMVSLIHRQAVDEGFSNIIASYTATDYDEQVMITDFYKACGFTHHALSERVVTIPVGELRQGKLISTPIPPLPHGVTILPFSQLSEEQTATAIQAFEDDNQSYAYMEEEFSLENHIQVLSPQLSFLLLRDDQPLAYIATAQEDDTLLFLTLHSIVDGSGLSLTLVQTLAQAICATFADTTKFCVSLKNDTHFALLAGLTEDCEGEMQSFYTSTYHL